MPDQPSSSSTSHEDDIASYLSFTNTTNIGAARAALQAAGWNLEAAVQSYFEPNSRINSFPNPAQERTASAYEPLSIDDSTQAASSNPRIRAQRAYEAARPRRPASKLLGFIFRLWAAPFRLLAAPVSFVADMGLAVFGVLGRLLGLRLPSISFHWPRSSSFGWKGHHLSLDPRTSAERFVRELEEDLQARSSYTHSQPGDPVMLRLPEFLLISYDEAVRKAKEEFKILMVVLVSEEHDDTAQFKRVTLMDTELLETLRRQSILVWGGDVRDRDASFAAQILDATTFPFVAFVSLQAKRTSATNLTSASNRSSTNLMTICTRLEGPAQTATSAQSIITSINTVVLPRTTPYLNRLKSEKARRDADRKLREEQDRAYAEAGRLDRERVLRKKAEMEAEAQRLEESRKKQQEQEQRQKHKMDESEQKLRWRYWAKKERMPQEPSEGGVTIGFRLGNGRRVIRRFNAHDSIESLYNFVDIESTGIHHESTELPRPRPGYQHSFSFRLSTAMPRRMLPSPQECLTNSLQTTISGFGGLDGANVNVEGNLTDYSSDEEEDEESET